MNITRVTNSETIQKENRMTQQYEVQDEHEVDADDWVDYLIQINGIESEEEYAAWILSTPITEVAQELANQPCDTPTAESLYDWAEGYIPLRSPYTARELAKEIIDQIQSMHPHSPVEDFAPVEKVEQWLAMTDENGDAAKISRIIYKMLDN